MWSPAGDQSRGPVVAVVLREVGRFTAVGGHDIDFGVAVAIGQKGDVVASRRPEPGPSRRRRAA